MNVKIIKTGEVKNFDDCFGARLIEQGIAVIVKKPEKKQKKSEKQE